MSTKWITEIHPWYVPGVDKIMFGGFSRFCELHFNHKFLHAIKTPEETYTFIQEIRKEHQLDKYLVFKKCPECGWELPVMDFDVGGWCSFCGSRKDEEKRQSQSSIKEAK